ncbi:MAG: hypothetical protein L3J54_13415 [Draconibacterium sp.]|nr:hypothetical protein [Draconibacterium sp.]
MGDWKLIHYYEDGHDELYNLKTDLEETTDVAEQNADIATKLSTKLFVMLDEMGARFPTKDPIYNAKKEKKYLEGVVNKRWPQLAKQRLNFLSKDFDPKNNWWGSYITED